MKREAKLIVWYKMITIRCLRASISIKIDIGSGKRVLASCM